MNVWSAEPLDLHERLRAERHDLLDLLGGLIDAEWLTPTPCARWRVKDVALHLFGDDLGWLSSGRDGDLDGPGTVVNLDFGTQARWHLVRGDHGWELEGGLADSPAAGITSDMDSAWRQLTGASTPIGAVTTSGPSHLAQPLLDVRGIIV
jgi:hypothetical protein